PVRVAQAEAERELADVVQETGGERGAAVAPGPLGERLGRGRHERGVAPEGAPPAASPGPLAFQRAPHGEAEHEVAHAREAEERGCLLDAGDARADREEGAVGEAQQPGGERLIAYDEGRQVPDVRVLPVDRDQQDRKSTRLNSSHVAISYA